MAISPDVRAFHERRKAENRVRLEEALANPKSTEQRAGIWYWRSNGHVIPDSVWREAGLDAPDGQAEARAADVARDLARYRETMRNHVPDAEELYEMRAAFGEGAEVVNVITGKVTRL